MFDEADFLNNIAAQPDDDQLRLVYADWLQENGDPNRAELIRLQCALALGLDVETRLPLEDPARGEALRNRERDLIATMLAPVQEGERPGVRELTPEIATILAGSHERITFHRGMICNLDLWGTPITSLPPGLYVGRDLDLRDTSITALPPGLHVGRDLDLAFTRITALPPDLHVGGNLRLWGTRITALPPGLYVGGNLNLTDTGITADAARHILDRRVMPNLSARARITALQTAGFPALADEARRQAEANSGPPLPSP